jgi:hypothetical protein
VSVASRAARPIDIAGPAGLLEAAVELPQSTPTGVAVLCHPHPLQQGTMQNKVVTTLARAFRLLGAAALRFNFRGVGRSAGSYDDGRGERDDALAVVRFARGEWPHCRVYLGGFSFGGAVALTAAAEARPHGLVTVAPAVARLPAAFAPPESRWLLVQGDRDDVVDAAAVLEWARARERPPEIAVLEGVGHFFHGQLTALQERVSDFFAADFGRA